MQPNIRLISHYTTHSVGYSICTYTRRLTSPGIKTNKRFLSHKDFISSLCKSDNCWVRVKQQDSDEPFI